MPRPGKCRQIERVDLEGTVHFATENEFLACTSTRPRHITHSLRDVPACLTCGTNQAA